MRTDVNARRPKWLYGDGAEPDPRFSLANERTYLAWIRTALALQAAGLAVGGLELGLHEGLAGASGAVLLALGTVSAVQGLLAWQQTEWALRHFKPLPAPVGKYVVALGLLLAGVLAGLAVVL